MMLKQSIWAVLKLRLKYTFDNVETISEDIIRYSKIEKEN